MSLSTSSSKAALAALGVVFATLLVCELSLRMGEKSISLDIAHLRAIPAIANSLAKGDGQRVLFLGSSLVREGVDLNAIQRGARGSVLEPVTLERVHPDDSRIAEWTYLFKHYFVDAKQTPDVIVIGFAGSHLEDYHPIPWDRIAAYYSSTSDLLRIASSEIDSFGTQVQFILAHFLRTFAHRERVGKRVFDLVIPHYRDSSRRINKSLRTGHSEPATAEERRYTRVEKLSELCSSHGVTLVLVAMPLRSAWEIPPELTTRAAELGVSLIDARDIPGMDNQSYKDSMHMNAAGAERFSRYLPKLLAPVLLEVSGRIAKEPDNLEFGSTAGKNSRSNEIYQRD